MKRILLTSVLCFCVWIGYGQNIDISIQTQFLAQQDTSSSSDTQSIDIDTSLAVFIQETYQIPCYGLYDEYWDTENLSSRFLQVPFWGNPLRIILVQSNNNAFFYPCLGELKTKYGETKNGLHPGIDFTLTFGSPVRNCFDGVVRMAKKYGDYGQLVVVRHYNGLETVYANLSRILVQPGQIIQAGHVIGASGKSVKTGLDVLHFETRFMNECFNPALFIDFESKELIDNTLILNEKDLAIVARQQAAQQTEKIKAEKSERIPENSKGVYHIVKAGETMYRIALEHNISLARLLEINNMTETDVISVGQKIRLE